MFVSPPSTPPTAAQVRMVACDLDGTVVRRDGTVSERTLAAFDRCERLGVDVVFVTGRPPRWLPPIAEATGHHGLAVCGNGAAVVDLTTFEVVRLSELPPPRCSRSRSGCGPGSTRRCSRSRRWPASAASRSSCPATSRRWPRRTGTLAELVADRPGSHQAALPPGPAPARPAALRGRAARDRPRGARRDRRAGALRPRGRHAQDLRAGRQQGLRARGARGGPRDRLARRRRVRRHAERRPDAAVGRPRVRDERRAPGGAGRGRRDGAALRGGRRRAGHRESCCACQSSR